MSVRIEQVHTARSLGKLDLSALVFMPPNPGEFVGGFFLLSKLTGVAAAILDKGALKGFEPTYALSKGVLTVGALVTHILARNSFTLGWFLGELNDIALAGANALAGALSEGRAKSIIHALSGVTGREAGFEAGGIPGRRYGFEQGQVTENDVAELRRLKAELQGAPALGRGNGPYAPVMRVN